MKELIKWLEANKIKYRQIDNEVVEMEGLGKLYVADLTEVRSVFRVTGEDIRFNLMESPEVLVAEGIFHVAFPFGDNWYYYNLTEGFRFNILKYAGVRQPCKMQVPFVNLGVHTPFELLNGSGSIADWVRKAKYLGHTALGGHAQSTEGMCGTGNEACIRIYAGNGIRWGKGGDESLCADTAGNEEPTQNTEGNHGGFG